MNEALAPNSFDIFSTASEAYVRVKMIYILKTLRRHYNATCSMLHRPWCIEGPSTNICTNVRYLQHFSRTNFSTTVSVDHLKSKKAAFDAVLPDILKSLLSDPKLKEVPDISSWLKKIFEYNLGGKCTRGLTTVLTYETLEDAQNITGDSMKLASVLGWCTEILQSYFIIQDDIIDNSPLRRGAPCWYRLPHVGLDAINDGILIYSSIFQILNRHFAKSPLLGNFKDLYNETIWYTSIGEHLDIKIPKNKDYSQFTIDNYHAIVKYKAAYYTYKLPIALGLHLVKHVDEENFATLEDICVDFGTLFQMQDDYIDCYGDESITGKVGTDIQMHKCTWLAVTALQHCSFPQRKVFTACYGSEEPAHVERIKRLYDQLMVPQLYKQREEELYNNIIKRVNALRCDSMRQLYLKLLEITYNRDH